MKIVFIVVANDRVSREGYDTYEKAKEFVMNRSGNIKQFSRYTFMSESDKVVYHYNIIEVDVK